MIEGNPDVKVVVEYSKIKLYLNNILHLLIYKEKLLGIQSWKVDGKYNIEYTFEDREILTEYRSRKLWEQILELIDKNL